MKLANDKYYTPEPLAKKLIYITRHVLKFENITHIIEPSAGNGAFSRNIPNCLAYDIEPEADGIIQADFLTLRLLYKKGRLCIGNPPFGTKNWMSYKFFLKCCEIADFIAFIQPISQLNNPIQLHQFDLIYSIDIGVVKYSDRELHCCFNIWRRPRNGKLNPKPYYHLKKDVILLEHRRVLGDYHTGKNKDIEPNWDTAFASWGNGCLGKTPEYVGQYASEIYVYIHNDKYRSRIMELLSPENLREMCKTVSMKRIGTNRLSKYLKEQIPELE